jgi:hypothetical protein
MNKFSSVLFKILVILSILFPAVLEAQTELVPVDHKVYPFFESLSMRGIIDYNNASIPISRGAVASYLKEIDLSKDKLTPTERKILSDLLVEFSYDVDKSTDKSFSLLSNLDADGLLNIVNDDKQKYLVSYADTSFSLFLDGIGSLSYRDFNAESFPKAHLTLGEIGPRLRGTLYNTVGFYIEVFNGKSLTGDQYARMVAAGYDPVLASSIKFVSERFIDTFDGYLRLENENHSVSLTIGRDNFEMGNGYIDKLFVSDNIPPFDFARLDINYKFFRYAFFYGNINGDSLGTPLASKNIVGHRLDIEFSKYFRVGMYESVIIPNAPISFTYFNPVSYLTSADFSAQLQDNNNALMGFDCEVRPVKNVGMQFSLLIDDLDWSTLGKKTPAGDDNKFGYQAGLMYVEPFGINDLTATIEYTLLDPFVYSHRTNMADYTDWGISIGHSLAPNSDEIALALDYYLTNRVKLNLLYKHQRSGEGFLDANGNPTFDDRAIITRNFGGDVNRGDLDTKFVNTFLMGFRVNHDIVTLSTRIEPIRQYFLDISYSFQSVDKIYMSKTYFDQFLYATISTDF